jgi:endonuclease YncB( thermonuclease family)
MLLAVATASLAAACSPGADDTTSDAGGVVVEVIDGDTIEVDGVGRVRLVGVDTPEIGDCGYDEARDQLADLVLGESVELVPGGVDDRDRYDRLLRYVVVDGVDAGLLLIEEGLAVSRYDSRDGYGEHQREQEYVQADAGAADERLCPAGQ